MKKIFEIKLDDFSNLNDSYNKIGTSGFISIEENCIRISSSFFSDNFGIDYFEFQKNEIVNVIKEDNEISFHVINLENSLVEKSFKISAQNDFESIELVSLLPENVHSQNNILTPEEFSFVNKLFKISPNVYITKAILAINIIIFSLMFISGEGFFEPSLNGMIRWGANVGNLTMDGQWWRLFTCTFIHFGIIHLFFNMWVLNSIGPIVERIFGNGFFLLIYIISGLTGSVLSIVLKQNVVSVGASGAIFGIAGALLGYLFKEKESIPQGIFISIKSSFFSFIIYNLIFGFMIPGIDNGAHIGGLLGGLIAGYFFSRPLDLNYRKKVAFKTASKGILSGVIFIFILSSFISKDSVEFVKIMKYFYEKEIKVNKMYNGLVKKAKAGKITDKELSKKIYNKCIPIWSDIIIYISKKNKITSKHLKDRINIIIRYSILRKKAMEKIVSGINNNNLSDLEDFKKYQTEANQIVERLKSK